MPQDLKTPQIIANEALALLRSNMVMAELVNTDYSDEFKKVGNTIDVRNVATLDAKDFASTIDVQDLDEDLIPVKLDRHVDVSVALSSKEQTLDLANYVKQVVEPAILSISTRIDRDIAAFIVGEAGKSVSATANTDLTDIANLAKTLDTELAPIQDRHLVLSPEHKYNYALKDNLSKVAYAGDNITLRDAELGKIYSLNTWMDQNMPKTNATTSGTATAYKVASAAGGEVALSSVSAATATVKIGDGFIYKGKVYRFTEDGTASDSAIASIEVSPAFPSGVLAASDVVLLPVASSVAFHKNAITFANRPLELPMGSDKAAYATDGNIAIRVVYSYDINTKKDVISFDVLYGLATLRKEFAVRLVGA